MKDLKDSIEVKISNPIKVQCNVDGKNDIIEIDTLYLKCFNKKDHQNITLLLRNKYKRMMLANTSLFSGLVDDEDSVKKNKPKNKPSHQEEVKSTLDILSISEGNDLISFYDKFKEFLLLDVAFKDESFKQKLLSVDLDNIDNDDLELIIANYIVAFFLAFWMK